MAASNMALFSMTFLCIMSIVAALECPDCTNYPAPGQKSCDSKPVPTITCGPEFDRCMTVEGKIQGLEVVYKNCSNSFLCDPDSHYYICKLLNKTGSISSCSVTCTQPSNIQEIPELEKWNKIDWVKSTSHARETWKSVSIFKKKGVAALECPDCISYPVPGQKSCDSKPVPTITCGPEFDRCMTVEGKIKGQEMTFVYKNCSNSVLCDPDDPYYMCKLLNETGFMSSCSVTCNQPSHIQDIPELVKWNLGVQGMEPEPSDHENKKFKRRAKNPFHPSREE
ncbi:hypothetical protein ABFA07_003940 [Porites harrisoni]